MAINTVLNETKRLLMGPDPREDAQVINFADLANRNFAENPLELNNRGPYKDENGNEVLRFARPSIVYNVGVLTPRQGDNNNVGENQHVEEVPTDEKTPAELKELARLGETAEQLVNTLSDSIDSEISASDDTEETPQRRRRKKSVDSSSMGVSFLCTALQNHSLRIIVSGGRYKLTTIPVGGVRNFQTENQPLSPSETFLYQHQPVNLQVDLPVTEFPIYNQLAADKKVLEGNDIPLSIQCALYIRPQVERGEPCYLITATLINCSDGNEDAMSLFQAHFTCEIIDNQGNTVSSILPYPEPSYTHESEEDKSMKLLYREAPKFATGHGCSANWEKESENENENDNVNFAKRVLAEPLPEFHVKAITPVVPGISPTMSQLAGENWRVPLEQLNAEYSEWLAGLNPEELEESHRDTGTRHLNQAQNVLERMQNGFSILEQSPSALRAFQLANKAMRIQQIASRLPVRKFANFVPINQPSFTAPYVSPAEKQPEIEPEWRAFQIGFLLTNIESVTNPNSEDRKMVDLIWFPTGGGKTEAYLGLIAFAIFYQRLTGEKCRHVQVLMRYTLRLLTSQQFQRAASLICAMEHIRAQEQNDLGTDPITLGIWVGNASTPNKTSEIAECLSDIRNNRPSRLFLHKQCPWCGAEVGTAHLPPKTSAGLRNANYRVLGFNQNSNRFKCSDQRCTFYNTLPLHVVDEILLEEIPTLLIATVDKFALLPKKPELRKFFGFNDEGERIAPAPSLIIQDELHLISEALGSMVGAFEPLVQYLCTNEEGIPPKIVCSTATIRTYKDQIRQLFARQNVSVFPPPEFSISNSFFTRLKIKDGEQVFNKTFIGIFGRGYRSAQTAQSIVMGSLLQVPLSLPPDQRNPYWSMMGYFSTIRELGTTLTLMQSAIRQRINQLQLWKGSSAEYKRRYINKVKELTSRTNPDDLTKIMDELGTEYSANEDENKAIDVCLATSIVEVGIDIPRLSLLCVVGQPKKTSTYIQATGRVGRSHKAMVATLYDISRARDYSIFESFRSYHERMYATVEPTNLTPFAEPVQERAIAAILAASVRLTSPSGNETTTANPSLMPHGHLTQLIDQINDNGIDADVFRDTPAEHLSRFIQYTLNWVQIADSAEHERLKQTILRRLEEWRDWGRPIWHAWEFQFEANKLPLLRDINPMLEENERFGFWLVPNSMRDVDSESQLWICNDLNVTQIPGSNDELYPHAIQENN